MTPYRDRLLGFLRSRAPGPRDALFHAVAREPPSSHPRADEDLAARFREELEAARGRSLDLRGREDRAAALRGLLADLAGKCAAIDADPFWRRFSPPLEGILEAAGLRVLRVDGSSAPGDLERVDLGVTVADGAIAETGTVVQYARPFRPRSLSLLPPRHLVVLPEDRLAAGFEEVLARARAATPSAPPGEPAQAAGSGGAAGAVPYWTWITGPSRTADIEKVLTVGVHGPAELTVVLVSEEE